ncbi:MAG: hypothetical protein U0228_16185 [Myxococcaceae bacterium]
MDWIDTPRCCSNVKLERDPRWMTTLDSTSVRVVGCQTCHCLWVEEWTKKDAVDSTRFRAITVEGADAEFKRIDYAALARQEIFVRCPICKSLNVREVGGAYEFANMRCGDCRHEEYADHYDLKDRWNYSE